MSLWCFEFIHKIAKPSFGIKEYVLMNLILSENSNRKASKSIINSSHETHFNVFLSLSVVLFTQRDSTDFQFLERRCRWHHARSSLLRADVLKVAQVFVKLFLRKDLNKWKIIGDPRARFERCMIVNRCGIETESRPLDNPVRFNYFSVIRELFFSHIMCGT